MKKNLMKNFELICTIGPSCEDENKLKILKNTGVDIFRVNLSHTNIESLHKFCDISEKLNLRIGVDTEGAQIRTKNFESKVVNLTKGDKFYIPRDQDNSSENYIIDLYPLKVKKLLDLDMLLRFDFNGAVAKVVSKNELNIQLECINSGIVGNNKGVDILNHQVNLPDFTEKDLEALDIARERDIKEVFISFCKSYEAVKKVKELVPNSRVTSKIESKLSINNLENICKITDALLIDRGDLTREISIMDIPFAQRGILKIASQNEIPCFIATNILESLINGSLPTRAELNDIIGTLEMGASGLVLAAETAIGKKPILCAEIVSELMHRFQLYKSGLLFADIDRNEITDEEMKIWLNRN